MSSDLPAVSGKQVIKALEQRGWYVKRIKGSHHALRHPTVPDTVVVPVHIEVTFGREGKSSITWSWDS